MANANQSPSSGRQQGRQQSSELGKTQAASAQQGTQGNQRAGQQTAWSPEQRTVRRNAGTSGYAALRTFVFRRIRRRTASMMRRISEDMDQLFESFGFGRGRFPGAFGQADVAGFAGDEDASLWAPRIEVYERDGKLIINADLPGVRKEDVHAEITSDVVTIRGQRKQEKTSSEGNLYRSERSYGAFYRTIALPDGVDTESAAANFRDGVLQIEMDAPQRPSRGRTLQIGDSGANATTKRPTSGDESHQQGSGSQQQR